jgi:hypothetical protein
LFTDGASQKLLGREGNFLHAILRFPVPLDIGAMATISEAACHSNLGGVGKPLRQIVF